MVLDNTVSRSIKPVKRKSVSYIRRLTGGNSYIYSVPLKKGEHLGGVIFYVPNILIKFPNFPDVDDKSFEYVPYAIFHKGDYFYQNNYLKRDVESLVNNHIWELWAHKRLFTPSKKLCEYPKEHYKVYIIPISDSTYEQANHDWQYNQYVRFNKLSKKQPTCGSRIAFEEESKMWAKIAKKMLNENKAR